jgi:hypothetical protein
MGVVNYLIQNPGSTASEIDNALCRNYAGLTPPALELIHVCLESYALQEDKKDGHWVIQPNDFPQKRHEDIQDIQSIIIGLGKKLGFKINKKDSDNAVVWFRTTPPLKYHIFITASAVLGKHLLTHNLNHQRFLIVLPGSRANLVAYKLKQNPVFRKIADQGWHFIKYRHIRRLADSSTLNLDNLNEQLMLDPLTYSKPQIRLL